MALKEAGINLVAKDNPSRAYRDEDWLRENYCDRRLSLHECGKLAGCDKTTILDWLRRFGIPRRTYRETTKAAWARGDFVGTPEKIKEAWARGAYGAVTEETRKKMSVAHKEAWVRFDNKEYRQKLREATMAARLRGCYDGEETRQRLREGLRAAHARGAYNGAETRQKQSDGMKAAWVRGTHDGVFQSPTSIEVAISEALDELGIMHVKQYRPEDCRFIYDEYLLAQGILLEVNGDYWHTREGMPERDALKGLWAREHGFIPVAIWEHEIKEYGAVSMIQMRVLGKG